MKWLCEREGRLLEKVAGAQAVENDLMGHGLVNWQQNAVVDGTRKHK
jgi:hypothetical protein